MNWICFVFTIWAFGMVVVLEGAAAVLLVFNAAPFDNESAVIVCWVIFNCWPCGNCCCWTLIIVGVPVFTFWGLGAVAFGGGTGDGTVVAGVWLTVGVVCSSVFTGVTCPVLSTTVVCLVGVVGVATFAAGRTFNVAVAEFCCWMIKLFFAGLFVIIAVPVAVCVTLMGRIMAPMLVPPWVGMTVVLGVSCGFFSASETPTLGGVVLLVSD